MKNNIVDIKDKKTLVRLLRNCYYVYGYVIFNSNEGSYVKLQKTDLMGKLLELDNIDMTKYQYDTHDNIVYIN
jgi:hypothetical protein|tara:strand:- start:31 stop:249 length:219 start_codon:yes stop_codon:yes gene_type:complete